MNVNDLDRLQVIEQVCKKKMKTKKAAKILGISVRQVKRLKKRFNKDGAKGLISQKVGTPSNNKISSEKRLLVLNFLNKVENLPYRFF
jgi:transposase